MKAILYNRSYFEAGALKFKAGETYLPGDEHAVNLATGVACAVEVSEPTSAPMAGATTPEPPAVSPEPTPAPTAATKAKK